MVWRVKKAHFLGRGGVLFFPIEKGFLNSEDVRRGPDQDPQGHR